MTSSFIDIIDPDGDGFAASDQWVREVRDTAKANSEGMRTIKSANGSAFASYEVAPLSGGRWALTYSCGYKSGNMSSVSSPWQEFDSREDCVAAFVVAANRHFERELASANCAETQRVARDQMLRLLNGGLFGFIEPSVDE